MNILNNLESYRLLINNIEKSITPIFATGVIDSQKIQLLSQVARNNNNSALIITHNTLLAKEILSDLRYFWQNDNVFLYPAKDILFYNADVGSKNITKQRLEVIRALCEQETPCAVVLSVEALFDKLTPKEEFLKYNLKLAVGNELPIKELANYLVESGYERSELVEGSGQFAIRGGIVDIFSPNYEMPLRIEYWSDEIDSLRFVDLLSQRSIDKVNEAKIIPMTERLEFLEDSQCNSLLDYFDKNTMLFFDEPLKIKEHAQTIIYEFNESLQNRILKGVTDKRILRLVYEYVDILHFSKNYKTVLMSSLSRNTADFNTKNIIDFKIKGVENLKLRIDLFIDDLKFYCNNKYTIVIVTSSKTRAERLISEMKSNNIFAKFVENIFDNDITENGVYITLGSLNKGFEYESINLVFITDKDLYGDSIKKKRQKKKNKSQKIESFTDLKTGDYVVHDNHGIGIYRGIEEVVTNGISKDYLKLTYADGGNLFIPTNQMETVQKYIGGEGLKLKLNKLGGGEFEKAKVKARKAVLDIAKDLIELYAKREAATGFQYSKDTIWQKEFEEMFPFDETEDQLNAIEDVKNDMQSSKVMDRLVCGDVGYGKTEVAIRAAFKSVQDGKQVAILVPTTILAQQHHITFSERMKDFPISIELLSRFRTPKQSRETIERIKSGLCDIVVGTHKLLGKDITFRNLGLIIVDEEQRFGVTHKEKMKKLKDSVDVLTLTATPIPRTLHMSLTGIRDMSLLEEPPHERQPIQTYVMEYSHEFVRDAILRELGRDGQVYYLYNRVRNIEEVASKISELVPEATIAYAHGQMSERELESVMIDFIKGEVNVLVCTTIIETGLDISNANTIIIHDADCMGLSQLYQLRGRVGRSNRQAYAYLMYKKDKVLQEIAEKRLQTIRDFTEFGSGFRVAMRDMEIRGAGNLFGGEQSGHMEAVGYEMYCKILHEVIAEFKNETPIKHFETTIDISINANIPEYYIKDESQKLEMYKKISLITTKEDFDDVYDELLDRFSDLPKSVQNLLDIALLKACAHKFDIESVSHRDKKIIMTFRKNAEIDVYKIIELSNKYVESLTFKTSPNPSLIYVLKDTKLIDDLKKLTEILLGSSLFCVEL